MKADRNFPDPPHVIVHHGFTFKLGKKLGEGGFAKCFEVIDELSGKRLALKAIFLDSVVKLKAQSKARLAVLTNRVFHDERYIYLLMELCENKTMVDLLRIRKTLSENEVQQYVWMILAALDYLHSRRIIHRDLKLGNLFLNLENEIKVGDFGLATTLDQLTDRKKTICGTPNYIAPEILFDKVRGHSVEVDVWALGVIMYTLLFGRPPFQSEEVKSIYRNIKENAYTFPQNTGVSTAACSLISLMLTTDPDKRPKVKELIQHSFFNQVIIKDPSYDDLASSRMFILQSIETQLQNTLATETSPRPMRTFKEGSKENIPAHTNIHMLEHTTPSPKATFNPI
ncbi:Cell cycle serine/threonine-protein kinase cdc5/MSD2, partial [Mitosporidium daphniae]